MNIGLAVTQFINNNLEYNLNNCFEFIKKAKNKNVDILIFGETYLQGFNSLSWKHEKDLLVGIGRKSKIIDTLCLCCNKNNIAIGIGYIEREEERLYSSYLVIDKNGKDLMNYRRISRGWRIKYSDNRTYMEENTFYKFDFMDHKMTAGLCGDFWTDEVIDILPKDIDIVLWPVFVHWNKNQWETSVFNNYVEQSKNISKNIFFVNSICKEEKSLSYGGAFAIIDNKIVASLELEQEDILVVKY
jgi:N-carbamoylputrescine amidase